LTFEELPALPTTTRLAACVRNSQGRLLMYTVQGSMAQVEEYQMEHNPFWEDWKRIGCHVVQIEVALSDCYWSRKNAYEATLGVPI
jgi:hypothetical protein